MTNPDGPPVVRRATADDLDALVALRAEMFRAMGTADVAGEWQEHARDWFAGWIERPAEAGVFVVEVDGVVVASAMGAVRDAAPSPSVPRGGDILVNNVCVLPTHRGRGLGRAAFDAVMAWARETGVGRAELLATQDGRGMYERSGFRLTDCPAMRAPLT